jgi:Xaa-Pro aminopeptidase
MPITPVVTPKPKAYLKVRHKAVREALKELKLDAIILTHDADLAWATNFTGEDSVGIITADKIVLVTDFRFTEQAAIEAGWIDVVKRDGKMSDALSAALLSLGVHRIGFEANFATFGQIHALDKAIADAVKDQKTPATPKVEFVPLENVMLNLRKVKDDHEIGIIRKSVEVAEEAFSAIRSEIKPGQTESYLAALLILELRSRGASDCSFPVIVATGPNSSLPHYRPKEVTVQRDQPLLFDWGAIVDGYCSDLTRTLFVGNVSPKIREIYQITLEAQLAAIAFLRPGVTCQDADRVARDVITRAGYGEFFGHGLGHGIGRDIHEGPRLSKHPPIEELRPGMIVTVEPGIYLPGQGGIRIEDDILITHSGCEVLSSLGKSLDDIHIA